jgi:hypothetical protein
VTRRQFFTAFMAAPAVSTTQFNVSGHFDHAGADNTLAYYSLGQSLSLVLDPRKLPAMVEQADKLCGKQARIILEAA